MSTSFIESFRAKIASTGGGELEVTLAKTYLKIFPSSRYKIYKMLARLMDAKIDASTSLTFIQDIVSNEGRNPNEMTAIAVRHWIADHREHGRLSEAFTGWVPINEVLLIEAGEKSTDFRQALDTMLRLNENLAKVRSLIVSKLAYPAGMTLLLCFVMYYLANNFIPPIVAIKGPNAQWTGSAGATIALLGLVGQWLIPTLIGGAIAIAVIIGTMPFFTGPVRAVFDRLPPWSIHRFMSGINFFAAVLVLMESDKGLVEALALTKPNASPYLASKIDKISGFMRDGENFGSALLMTGENFPDLELIKEIQLFERIGRLDDGLAQLVEQWMVSATQQIGNLVGMASNSLMFLAFGALGFVFNGVYDIIGQLK